MSQEKQNVGKSTMCVELFLFFSLSYFCSIRMSAEKMKMAKDGRQKSFNDNVGLVFVVIICTVFSLNVS